MRSEPPVIFAMGDASASRRPRARKAGAILIVLGVAALLAWSGATALSARIGAQTALHDASARVD